MKTAFDKPCVQHTKVSVILFKGEVAGKIITGITKGHGGATSTVQIFAGPLIKENEILTSSKTMAGGGMNFEKETVFFALSELIRLHSDKGDEDADMFKSSPWRFLKVKGYEVMEIL